MKVNVFILGLYLSIALSGFSFAQNTKSTARVDKIQGIETYVLCEPLREYETVFDVATGVKAASLLTGGVVNEGVADKANQFVNRAIKQGKKDNVAFDAVLISGSKTAIAIKFKDAATEKTKGLARVKRIDGLDVFVLNEPLTDYETTVDASGGIKAKSYLTGGLVNNSIEEDVAQFIKRIKKESDESKKPVDGVIYSGGKSAIGIKFK